MAEQLTADPQGCSLNPANPDSINQKRHVAINNHILQSKLLGAGTKARPEFGLVT